MSIVLTLELGQYVVSGEVISYIIMIISAILCLVALPIALIYMIFQPTDKLLEQRVLDMFSGLYSNLNIVYNIDNKPARAYYFLFILRRILYIIIA